MLLEFLKVNLHLYSSSGFHVLPLMHVACSLSHECIVLQC